MRSENSFIPTDRLYSFSEHSWADQFVKVLMRANGDCVVTYGRCNSMFTGGRSVEMLYMVWAK